MMALCATIFKTLKIVFTVLIHKAMQQSSIYLNIVHFLILALFNNHAYSLLPSLVHKATHSAFGFYEFFRRLYFIAVLLKN